MSLTVSVVIPVYNAAPFVAHAVRSALAQPEAGEVILVEDGSSDNSLEICLELVKLSSRIKLFRHKEGANLGAGATRNFGIDKAIFEYIAFLDADDYFLPHRFKETVRVFQENADADAVYEAAGHFIQGKEDTYKIYTINRSIAPEKLFHYLLKGTYGHFHTNAITFKKGLLKRTNVFDTTLRLHQDSELWLRFAFYGKLYPGELQKPVTMVRMHENNRFKHSNEASRLQFWKAVSDHFVNKRVPKVDYVLLLLKYCRARAHANKTHILHEFRFVLKNERSKVIKLIF
jgi:glycosyltransferase involved in cell wall biosynthesis